MTFALNIERASCMVMLMDCLAFHQSWSVNTTAWDTTSVTYHVIYVTSVLELIHNSNSSWMMSMMSSHSVGNHTTD